jgi:hypothetical protein
MVTIDKSIGEQQRALVEHWPMLYQTFCHGYFPMTMLMFVCIWKMSYVITNILGLGIDHSHFSNNTGTMLKCLNIYKKQQKYVFHTVTEENVWASNILHLKFDLLLT